MIRKYLKYMILTGIAQLQASPKVSVLLNAIQPEESNSITRAEFVVLAPKKRLDAFASTQIQDVLTQYRARVQYVPFESMPIKLGVVVESFGQTHVSAQTQLGSVMRFVNKGTNHFFRSDVRYFPNSHVIGTKTFFDSPKIWADVFGSYNLETRAGAFTPGVDYKIGSHARLGVEFNVRVKDGQVEKRYGGVRAGYSF